MLTTARTKVVDGSRTRVVEDRLYLDNVLEERTSDYYAQDRCGNVWYFGEDTATLDRARARRQHRRLVPRGRRRRPARGLHAGAPPGRPPVSPGVVQGHAEDTFSVVSRSSPVTVPFGTFRHALRTEETTALEPEVLDNKYYVRGIGEVAELSVRGPREVARLVEIIS